MPDTVLGLEDRPLAHPLDKDAIIRNFDLALKYGRTHFEPYLHYQFRPFSNELYEAIQSNLPEDSAYIELRHQEAIRPDGTSARLVLPFSKASVFTKLAPEQKDFWGELNAILCGDEIRDIFLERFESELILRFGDEFRSVPIFPKLMLMRDLASYKISIHHDIEWKTITTQYYLPSDHSQALLGTGIYKREGPGQFVETHRMEFTPGNAYAFAVSKNSWHAVEPVGDLPKPRNSMMLIYFNQQGHDY